MIAAVHARKSTEQNGLADEAKSVTRQIDQARAYATRKGWTIAEEHIYSDDGISGSEFVKRPGFIRLMNAVKPRAPFQALIMSEESPARSRTDRDGLCPQADHRGRRESLLLPRGPGAHSAMDKVMLSLTNFADEMERERARQRTADAMTRKAKAGHVTGGKVFGYDNVEVAGDGADGTRRRLHVVRVINGEQADVVRRIFHLCATGLGLTRIAKTLNEEGVRPPRGMHGWAASAIREILYRPTYRGEIVWNKIRKRDQWGVKKYLARPEADWLRLLAPELRIVSDECGRRPMRAWTRPAPSTPGAQRAAGSWPIPRPATSTHPTCSAGSPSVRAVGAPWGRSRATSSARAGDASTGARTTTSADARCVRTGS
jgi:DNA invertase Pin-like site-specific DNA recombinase